MVGQYTKIFWAYSAKEFGGYFHNLMAHIGNSEIDISFVLVDAGEGSKRHTDQEINWHFSEGHPIAYFAVCRECAIYNIL